jgi:mandelamide amidase
MIAAPPIGEAATVSIQGRPLRFEVAIARNIAPGSTAGIPGLVLPAGLTSAGLPVGMEFDAPAAADRALLALGVSLERALGPIPPPNI